LRREKELTAKAESADAARSSINNYDARIEELELQIQKLIAERNDLEIKLEEALQDSGVILLLYIQCFKLLIEPVLSQGERTSRMRFRSWHQH